MKAYRGWCIDPRVLDPGTSWRWVVSFTPRPLYSLGKSPCYPLDRRLDEPRTGLDDVEKRKMLPLPGLELRTVVHLARSQSLYRLRCPGSHTDFQIIGRTPHTYSYFCTHLGLYLLLTSQTEVATLTSISGHAPGCLEPRSRFFLSRFFLLAWVLCVLCNSCYKAFETIKLGKDGQ
jgi:hypothetical protein